MIYNVIYIICTIIYVIIYNTKPPFQQEGNDYGTVYQDYTYIKRPLLRIKVVGTPPSTTLHFEPTLENMRVLIIKWFHTIINVNHQIPSVDSIMYPGTYYIANGHVFAVLKLFYRCMSSYIPTCWTVVGSIPTRR